MRVRGSHRELCTGDTPEGLTILGVEWSPGDTSETASWTHSGGNPYQWRLRIENVTHPDDQTVLVDGASNMGAVINPSGADGDAVNVWLDALDSCGNVLASQMGDYTMEG